MKKIISIMLAFMLITTSCFAGTFTKTSNGTSISINVDQGKTILLKAREIFGKIFTGWTITGATVTDASLSEQTITMPSGNVTATANYATPYTVTVEQTANGVISPSTVTVAGGSSKTFTITPNTGHEIEDVLVNGVSVLSSCVAGTGDAKTYTMSGINGNKTITVTYSSTGGSGSSSIIIPTISVTSKTTNSITVSTSAVDPSGGNLVYKLYANGVLMATSSALASGSSVSLTASELSEKSLYCLGVECYQDGNPKGLGHTVTVYTQCGGKNATGCSVASSSSSGFRYWCRSCSKLSSNRCSAHSSMNVTVYGYTCLTHGGIAWATSSSSTSNGTTIYYVDHCLHGQTSIHDLYF